MPVTIDSSKARQAAELLYNCFSKGGILGHKELQDLTPQSIVPGSLDNIMFITLTVSIGYQRSDIDLWNSAAKTFEDPDTRYLFNPGALYQTPMEKIMTDMKKYGLSRKHINDPRIWRTVGAAFHKKWGGNPVNLLEHCGYDAPTILKVLKESTHLDNNKKELDFPFLRGDKIGPLWIKLLGDHAGITGLKNLDKVPIPVDIHVARSSLMLGVVKGRFEGKLEDLFADIRRAWFEGVDGLSVEDRPMIAQDINSPLWHLSKYGCTNRSKLEKGCPAYDICEGRNMCMPGKISIVSGRVDMDT